MASLTEIGSVFLGKMKILKVHTSQTGLKTNDGQQMNRKAPLNFQYRIAKKLIAYLDPTLRKVSLNYELNLSKCNEMAFHRTAILFFA